MADAFARHLRNNLTEAEKQLWRLLRDFKHRGFHFRRQMRLGPCIADFVTLGAKLVVELDGGQHGERRAVAHDEARTAFLNAQGFGVLRFWNDQIFADVEEVARLIDEELKRRAPFQHSIGARQDEGVAPITPKPSRSRTSRKLPGRRRDPHP